MALPLSCFSEPGSIDKRTVREIDDTLEEGKDEMRVFNDGVSYPLIDIHKKIILKQKASTGRVEDCFIEKPVNHWKKVFLLTCSSGFGSALKYLASTETEVISPGRKIARFMAIVILYLFEFIMGLYYKVHPYSKLNDNELCDEFCTNSNEDFVGFAWHPTLDKCAIALSNNDVYIYSSDRTQSQLIKHPCQKKITNIIWKPKSNNVLTISCQNLILIWNLEMLEKGKHELNDCVQIIRDCVAKPITSIAYDINGEHLVACSPRSSRITLIKFSEKRYDVKNISRFNTGFTKLIWSPDGLRLVALTTGKCFYVFETINWSCISFGHELNDVCQTACWSHPDGRFLLIALKNDDKIYALPFYEKAQKDDVGRFANRCEPVLDCSQVTLSNGSNAGGRIQDMCWDQNGQRLAVSFKDNPKYIAVYSTSAKSVIQFSEIGFVHGLADERPVLMDFHENFKHGALLAVCFSSMIVSYIPLQYNPNEARAKNVIDGTPRSLSNFSISLPKSRRNSNLSPYKPRDNVLSPREPTLFSVVHRNTQEHNPGFIIS